MFHILTHLAHSVYQEALAQVPETRYYHIVDDINDAWWDHQVPCPSNVEKITLEEACKTLDRFDFMLIHHHPRLLHWKHLQIPKIFVEHTHPFSDQDVIKYTALKEYLADYVVFITDSNQQAWKPTGAKGTSVIYHAIPVGDFPAYIGGEDFVMTACNAFKSRDWATGYSFWNRTVELLEGQCKVGLYGFGNKDISRASGRRTRAEILGLMQHCAVYFNPTQKSPIPLSLLEAAAVGCPIVSTCTCAIPDIFEREVGGGLFTGRVAYLVGSPESAAEHIIELLRDRPTTRAAVGMHAREVVREKFSPQVFQQKYYELFERMKMRKGGK